MSDEIDFWENKFRQQSRTAVVNSTAQDRKPEDVARARRMAHYANVTPAVAEAQPEVVGRMVEAEQNKAVIAQHPSMLTVLQDPDMAAMVGKGNLPAVGNILGILRQPPQRPRNISDYYPLARIERTPKVYDPGAGPAPTTGNIAKGVWTSVVGGAKQLWQGASLGLLDANESGKQSFFRDHPELQANFEGRSRGAAARQYLGDIAGIKADYTTTQAHIDATTPSFRTRTGAGLYGGASSLAQMLPAMIASVATRSPYPGIGIAAAQAGVPSYAKYRARGATPEQAARGALVQAGAEAAGELLPFGTLASKFGRGSTSKFLAEYTGKELLGEEFTTVVQDAADTSTGVANPDWAAYLAARPDAAYQTALGVLVMGGATGAFHHTMARAQDIRERVATKLGNKPLDEAAQDVDQGIADHAMLKASMEAAGKHPSTKAAPEAISRFIAAATQDSPIRDVYIPIEAIDALAESDSLSSEEQATLTLYQSQIEEARASGGDVVVPIGDFHTQFQTLFPKLQDDIRLRAGGMSAKEAATGRDAAIAEIEKIAKEMDSEAAAPKGEATKTQAQAERTPKQQVYDQVKAQMLKAKRPLVEAQTTALLAASRAETLASSRYGQFPDAMAAHKAVGFTVQKGGSGKNAKAVRTVNQPGPAYDAKAQADPAYAYHVTTLDNLPDIQQAGALTPFDPSHGTDQEVWPDGSTTPRIYMADTPAGTEPFQQERPVLVRAKRTSAIRKERGTLDLYSETAVGDLEYLDSEGNWHKIVPTEDVFSSTTGDGTQDSERTVYQSARGKTDWFKDNPHAVVTLFAEANFSTMLHEMSHVFLEQEFALAQHPNASPELKADVEKIKAWMAANGHPVGEDGVIPSEAHELWARSGERYFREGNAPSAELRDAFASFKKFLTEVYKSIKALTAYGKAPLSDDIRQVMDRIVATSEAIDDNFIAPMSQADLGMSDAEYKAYLNSVKATKDEAEDKLINRAMSAIRARETSRIAEQRKNLRDKLSEEFNQQPGIVALHLLRTGKWLGQPDRESTPVKLNTGWLIDNYGEEILNLLPRGLPITRGDGVDGDVVAEMTGMSSGDALVKALVGLRVQSDALRAAGDKRSLREAYVAKAVDAEMQQRHGDVGATEESIREEAIATLNSEKQGERLATELRALKRRKGQGGTVTPYQILKEWARTKIGEGRVSEVASKAALQRYVRAHDKARTAFEAALVKGDQDEAIRQKQAQMINHALLAEAKRMADALEPIVKRMKRYAEREAMPSIDQDYMDRIHALLAGFSFRAMTQKAIDERNGFIKWAAAQAEQLSEVHVPPRMGDLSVRNWKEATVADLLDLNDTLQSLIHLGRLKEKLTVAGQERALREFKDDSRTRILALPERRVPEASIGGGSRPLGQALREAEGIRDVGTAIRNVFSRALGGGMRQIGSEIIKVESLLDQADGVQDGTGPLNQLVVQGADACANTFSRLQEEVAGPLAEIIRSISNKYRRRLNDHITIPELTLRVSIDPADTEPLGKPIGVSRMQHIGMLLNTGNLSNLSKMVGGEKWGDHESMTDLAAVRDILWSHASPEDKAFVEAIWAGVGKLWPHIARTERAMSGVVPEQVEALSFDTPHGPVAGGYWPVVWDSARTQMGQDAAKAEDQMFGIGIGVSTPVGHTITRTGATAPMEYGVERVLFSHLNKVISRIAYAEWVRDTLKVMNSASIKGAMDLRLGAEYHKGIESWIKDQIPSSAVHSPDAKMMEKFLTQARVNMTAGVLGLSYSTGLSQTLGLAYSAGVLGEGSKVDGAKYLALGIWATLKHMPTSNGVTHMGGAQDFVFARSEEMSRRMHEVNRESIDVFRRLKDKDTLYRRAQAAAFWHIGFMDLNTVSIPTWLGAYAKGLHNGMTEEEAARYGDKVVRKSQGSGRAKDLSKIQRGGAAQKLFTAFYTPGAVFASQQWEAIQHVKAGNYSKAIMPTFYFLTMTTLLDALMNGDWPDDPEGDGWVDDIATWAGRNVLFGLAFGLPFARDIANTGERWIRGEYATIGATPYSSVMESFYKGGVAVHKVATNEDGTPVEGKDVKAILAGLGAVGLPGGTQLGRTAGFVQDVRNDATQPEGWWDWYNGITSGTPKAPKGTAQ